MAVQHMAAALVNVSAAQPTSVVSWVIEKDDFDAHPWVVRLCYCCCLPRVPQQGERGLESYSADYAASPDWNVHRFAGHIIRRTFRTSLLYTVEVEGHCSAVPLLCLCS